MFATKKMYHKNPTKVAEILKTKRVYSIYDLMEEFDVSRTTIYTYIKEGLLSEAPYQLGTLNIWRQEEVDQLINNLSEVSKIVVGEK